MHFTTRHSRLSAAAVLAGAAAAVLMTGPAWAADAAPPAGPAQPTGVQGAPAPPDAPANPAAPAPGAPDAAGGPDGGPGAPPPVHLDPVAQQELDSMKAAYGAVNAISVTLDFKTLAGTVSKSTQTAVAFKRPNLFYAAGTMDETTMKAVSDGKNMFVDPGNPVWYLKLDAAPDDNILVEADQVSQLPLGILPMLLNKAHFLGPIPQYLTALTPGDAGDVDGTPVDVLNGKINLPSGETGSVTMAVGKTDHLLRKFTLEMNTAQGKTVSSETYSNIKTDADVKTAVFTFNPPAGSMALTSPAMHDPRLKPGLKPASFHAQDLEGKPISLAQYTGKVVLLDFWATWCPGCVEEMPNVVNTYRKYHSRGLEIVGVSLDQAGAQKEVASFMKAKGVTWRQVYDGKGWMNAVSRQYLVMAIPFWMVVGRDGKIVAIESQNQDQPQTLAGTDAELQHAIRLALNGKSSETGSAAATVSHKKKHA